jgi:hypothetical protein
MDNQEYNAWQQFMKESRGHWTVDPVHDGVHRDLILFRCDPQDHTKGVYISVSGPEVQAGTFDHAFPHLTEGWFHPEWSACFPDKIGEPHAIPKWEGVDKPCNAALTFVIERLGVDGLLALLEGRSPYRSL